jgi:hypothetical protein
VDRYRVDEIVTSDDTERTVSHFIPSVELTGSRGEKLRKLDTLILYLAQLRRSLARDATRKPQICGENAAGVERAAWVRFTAGIAVGAVSALLLFIVGRWAI